MAPRGASQRNDSALNMHALTPEWVPHWMLPWTNQSAHALAPSFLVFVLSCHAHQHEWGRIARWADENVPRSVAEALILAATPSLTAPFELSTWRSEANESAATSAKPGDCVDKPPPSSWSVNTCPLQKARGKCGHWHNRYPGGYCPRICGRCPPEQGKRAGEADQVGTQVHRTMRLLTVRAKDDYASLHVKMIAAVHAVLHLVELRHASHVLKLDDTDVLAGVRNGLDFVALGHLLQHNKRLAGADYFGREGFVWHNMHGPQIQYWLRKHHPDEHINAVSCHGGPVHHYVDGGNGAPMYSRRAFELIASVWPLTELPVLAEAEVNAEDFVLGRALQHRCVEPEVIEYPGVTSWRASPSFLSQAAVSGAKLDLLNTTLQHIGDEATVPEGASSPMQTLPKAALPCVDRAVPSDWEHTTCELQLAYGKCAKGHNRYPDGYCPLTCNRCPEARQKSDLARHCPRCHAGRAGWCCT